MSEPTLIARRNAFARETTMKKKKKKILMTHYPPYTFCVYPFNLLRMLYDSHCHYCECSSTQQYYISTILRYWFDWWIFIFRRVYSVIFFACSILTFFFIFLLFYWCVWLFAMENWVWLERKRAKMRERNKRVVSPREPKAERARERNSARVCFDWLVYVHCRRQRAADALLSKRCVCILDRRNVGIAGCVLGCPLRKATVTVIFLWICIWLHLELVVWGAGLLEYYPNSGQCSGRWILFIEEN